MAATESLSRTLERGRRRLGLRVGLRRAGWLLLAAILTAELALMFGVPTLLVAAGLLLIGAVYCLFDPPRPCLTLTAAVLDATLDRGAVIATGAEALEGEHPRFAPRLVREAEEALTVAPLGALLPLHLPTGLILGGAAALLLPLLLPQARAQPDALASVPEPPSLLAPDVLGGAGAGAEGADPPNAEPAERFQVTVGDPNATEAADPLAHLPLDVRQALEDRLRELSKDLPAPASGGAARQAKPLSKDDPLAKALRDADPKAALAELQKLADEAKQGDAAAVARLRELSAQAGAAGAGAATADPQPVDDTGDDDAPRPARAGDRTPLPWALREAVDKYFAPR